MQGIIGFNCLTKIIGARKLRGLTCCSYGRCDRVVIPCVVEKEGPVEAEKQHQNNQDGPEDPPSEALVVHEDVEAAGDGGIL